MHTEECIDYNLKYESDTRGECVCPESCNDCGAILTEQHDQKSHEFFKSI